LIADKIQAPALVGSLRDHQRRPCSQRSFASAAPSHLSWFSLPCLPLV
jgi:hypothetical protein